MHKLLREQIQRYLGSLDEEPKEVRALLDVVDSVYQESDLLRKRLENSRDNISEELIKRQEKLQKDIEERDQSQLALKSYAKRLETLHEIDRAILKAESPQDIACAAVKLLREVLSVKRASVSLVDFETGEMIEVCVSREDGLDKSQVNRYVLDDKIQVKLRKEKSHIVRDLNQQESNLEHESRFYQDGIRSYLMVPLIARDHLVGSLDLGAASTDAFGDEQIRVAIEVADQVAVSVQQAALLDEVQRLNENLEIRIIERTAELEQRAHEISLLNDMGELLQSCVNTAEAYKVISQHIPRIFPYRDGSLGVLTNSGKSLEFKASWGIDIHKDSVFSSDDCWALRRAQPHWVEVMRPGLLCKHVEEDKGYQPWFSTFCIPLLAQGKTFGILYLRNKTGTNESLSDLENDFTEANRQLAMTVGEQIALALANLNLQETLRMQAIRDPLTGLFNRRYMEESLASEIQRSARTGNELGVIMLDIDHFKEFNDKFGHQVGDAMLRELGSFLQDKVRREDIACKYGGEEFVLIMPNAGPEITQERAELIRAEIKNLQVHVDGRTFENITLSLGISIFPQHGGQWEHILRAADVALYQAKANGRDQVVMGKAYKQSKKESSEAQTSFLD